MHQQQQQQSRRQSQNMSIASLTIYLIVVIAALSVQQTNAKLLRSRPYFDDGFDMGYGPGGAMATGERAIITVAGARNPYSGRAPSKIALEDNPYRGPFPAGPYDRLDRYGGRGRMPLYPNEYSGYGGYGGYGSGGYGDGLYNGGGLGGGLYQDSKHLRHKRNIAKRRDFLDPDFGVKASVRLENERSKGCRIGTEADSEIPELGLDSARLNVDCGVNPTRIADAAFRVARHYKRERNARRQSQPKKSRSVRKRTRIELTREVEKNKGDDDDRDEGNNPSNYRHRYNDDEGNAADDDDDDAESDIDRRNSHGYPKKNSRNTYESSYPHVGSKLASADSSEDDDYD